MKRVLPITILLMTCAGEVVAQASDVNCVRCVDTTDIQLGAITSGRLRDGAVRSAKIRNGAVTVSKLALGAVTNGRIADGAVSNRKIAPLAIREGRVATGAVSTSKIRNGAVTAAKLAPDAVDVKTLVVSPVGPGAADNCDELRDTLASITDNSRTVPYLVKVEPGVYDCGGETVAMKPYVDIEGSGRGVTRFATSDSAADQTATFKLASNAELRSLTIDVDLSNTPGSSTNALSDGDQPLAGSRVTDVHITSSAENTAQGINLLGDSALTVTDSIIEATAQTNTIGVYGYYADAVTVELVVAHPVPWTQVCLTRRA